MKIKIIKKMLNERTRKDGETFTSKSLFVSFEDETVYKKLVSHLQSLGASPETIDRFLLSKVYEGKNSYSFGLNCGETTFNRVQAFAEMDVKINFSLNNTYINARIAEKGITSYTPPVEIDEWACNPPEVTDEVKNGHHSFVDSDVHLAKTVANANKIEQETEENDLPF